MWITIIFLSRIAVIRAWTGCQPLTGKFSFRSLNLCLWGAQIPQKIKLSLSSFFYFLPLHPSDRKFHNWCLTVVIKWLGWNFRDLSNTSPSSLPPNKKPFREQYLSPQSQWSPSPANINENVPRRDGEGHVHFRQSHSEAHIHQVPAPHLPIVMTRQGIMLNRLTSQGLGTPTAWNALHSKWEGIKTSPLHPRSPTWWQYFCHRNTWLSAPAKQPWMGIVACCQNEKWSRAKGLGAAMLTVKEP